MATHAKSSPSDSKSAPAFVALLRGINVGGNNMLPMADLITLFKKSGCENVTTYIQSGNIVFSAAQSLAKQLPQLISKKIAEKFDCRVPVVLRTADELSRVATNNPFLKSGADPKFLFVAFLADQPDAHHVAALDPKRSPGDSFKVIGKDMYLCFPSGVAGSKFTNAYLDKTLATVSTARNWRTVLKLLELTQAIS
jgi:uncharacterized protein (DUF1697 family)